MKKRIYDCFCYFNEDHILELRLETLWDVVDYFIISEASYSHAGNARELHFDINRFKKFESKIRYIPLHERPPGPNDFWKNENFIRNNVSKGLYDAQPDDLIIVSDLDEIPEPKKIMEFDTNYIRGDFDQRYYSYYLNNYWIGDVNSSGKLISGSNIWKGSKITTYGHFTSFFNSNATSVRSYKSSGLLRSIKRSWFRWFHVQTIKEGGWHFTWIFTLEDLIKKIENTAHQEFNNEEHKNPERLMKLIESGQDFNKPLARYELQSIDGQFPKFLIENQERFKSFIKEKTNNA